MSPLTPELGKIKPTLLLSPLALMELLAQILSTRHKNVIIATSCSTDQELTHTQLEHLFSQPALNVDDYGLIYPGR